jgi:hypothetical protein
MNQRRTIDTAAHSAQRHNRREVTVMTLAILDDRYAVTEL